MINQRRSLRKNPLCHLHYLLGAGKSLLVHNEIDTLEEVYKKVQAVTAEQIMEVAEEIFAQTSTLIYH